MRSAAGGTEVWMMKWETNFLDYQYNILRVKSCSISDKVRSIDYAGWNSRFLVYILCPIRILSVLLRGGAI